MQQTSRNLNLSEEHLEIYNLYLKYLAMKGNRPYSKCKSIKSIGAEKYVDLIKLGYFFERNPEVNRDLYFRIGFQTSIDSFQKLNYFLTPYVLKQYSKFEKEQYNKEVTSSEVLDDYIEGWKFIVNYINDNKLTIKQYINQENQAGIPIPLIHLKEHKITLYNIHGVGFIPKCLPEEILNLYVDNFWVKFGQTQTKYNNTNKLNEITTKVKQLINDDKYGNKL